MSFFFCTFAPVIKYPYMILDKIENADLYFDSVPGLEKFIQFYNDNDLDELPTCRIRLSGDDLYFNINELKARAQKDIPLEAHRDYIDIQIPLSGTEKMGWRPQEDCQDILKSYDEGKDIELYSDLTLCTFDVPVGYFVVFFPSDAHQPGIVSSPVHKKLVVKSRVQA